MADKKSLSDLAELTKEQAEAPAPEATEAVFYLSSIGKGPRRAARRVSSKRGDVPTKRGAKDGSEGIS